MSIRRARILIVEDEGIVAMDLQRRVTHLGHEVLGPVATADAAIRTAGEQRPDLILMDIRLKGDVDGVTAAEEISRRWSIPITFLTAFSDTPTIRRATASEPFGYVLKPVGDRELEIAIEVALYRHDAETRMRRVERWLATTLTSIGDGVITADLNGRVVFMNPRAQKLTGRTIERARGRPLPEVLPLVDGTTFAPIEHPVRRVLSEGVVIGLAEHTLLVQEDGGRIPINDSAAPIRDEAGQITGIVIVFREVTAQRKAAEAQHQSQKLAAVGQLAGGVAHEFNNLMTVVLGFSELALAAADTPPSLRAPMERIHQAGSRAAELTKQLLTFGRRNPSHPAVLDLNAVVSDVLPTLRRVVGDRVRIVTALPRGLPAVSIDKAQLEQAMVNLAANARDAMAHGGTLTISTRVGAPGKDLDNHVVLSLADTGVGMTPEILEHLFEPFFTTKEVGAGTGLGLASVYGTVAESGGHIEVDSKPGRGTVISIQLPAVEKIPSAIRAVGDTAEQGAPAAETILLVVDDLAVRGLIARVLSPRGYTLLEAADAATAVDLVSRHAGDVHLLITDAVIPDGSGAALSRRISSLKSHIKTLLLSGYAEGHLALMKSDGPPIRFIHKPFSAAALAEQVRDILRA